MEPAQNHPRPGVKENLFSGGSGANNFPNRKKQRGRLSPLSLTTQQHNHVEDRNGAQIVVPVGNSIVARFRRHQWIPHLNRGM